MKSIFIYNGSRSKESRSQKLINNVISNINNNYEYKIKFNIYSPITHLIKNCEGCCNCFYNGECKLDNIDDMKKIKSDIIKADIIILMTPVYAHNVSGDMKIFIDRISYWLHYMRLFNKKGIILVSNGNNGGKIVIEYLNKVMAHLGISVIAAYENDMINEATDADIMNISDKIMHEMKTNVKSNAMLEDLYISKVHNCIYNKGSYQYTFLEDNKFFENDSFEELLSNTNILSKF